jgi:crotonobetainyl-CoA:carnitine CoA-transferase CaiB-like acyl-CoA transferase
MQEHPTMPASATASSASAALSTIWSALGGDDGATEAVRFTGSGDWPSAFPVSDLACASIAAAALAVAELVAARRGAHLPRVTIDRRLTSLWFGMTIAPQGWELPPTWDAIAGDYPTSDGWIRLHTNAPHHRAAALEALGVPGEREPVAAAVAGWEKAALQEAVVAAGGCAAAMHDAAEWAAHPQGAAVAAEPLIWQGESGTARPLPDGPDTRPLAGLRILDLTRIFAGPVATRFLAGFGATVLRIDPPGWEEPTLAPEVTPGKRCARLDLKSAAGAERLRHLIAEADILVHGYRPGALDGLGLGAEARRALNPGLIDVSLCAYGWTGPWAGRRGFDSLVQMSSGIAATGAAWAGDAKPKPLPVQALDHATGYLMAAATIRGLTRRALAGKGSAWRTSLARTARLLADLPAETPTGDLPPPADADYSTASEPTGWGPARRLRPPAALEACTMRWDSPATPLGAAPEADWA